MASAPSSICPKRFWYAASRSAACVTPDSRRAGSRFAHHVRHLRRQNPQYDIWVASHPVLPPWCLHAAVGRTNLRNQQLRGEKLRNMEPNHGFCRRICSEAISMMKREVNQSERLYVPAA